MEDREDRLVIGGDFNVRIGLEGSIYEELKNEQQERKSCLRTK